MMRRGIIYILCVGLLGCANFAASVSGTFIGNIASDRVLKEMDKERFYEMLDAFENELENMDWENKYYPDEETWEDAKEELIDKAEDNDYIGELAIVDASGFDVDEIDSRTRLIYRKGKTGFQHMIGGATDALSGGHTFGGGRKGTHTLGESKRNRRNYRRY